MIQLIHTFELLILVNYDDIRHLFLMYGLKLDRYHYFHAAVKQLNREIKKNYPAYAITCIWNEPTGDWYLKLKVDAVKMLKRGKITEADYNAVELDIRKYLIHHFGH